MEKKAYILYPEKRVLFNGTGSRLDRTFKGSLCRCNLVTRLVLKMSWSCVIFIVIYGST